MRPVGITWIEGLPCIAPYVAQLIADASRVTVEGYAAGEGDCQDGWLGEGVITEKVIEDARFREIRKVYAHTIYLY